MPILVEIDKILTELLTFKVFFQDGGHSLLVPCSQRFLTPKQGKTLTAHNSKRF